MRDTVSNFLFHCHNNNNLKNKSYFYGGKMIETVLGKAAMYLNARIPEIQSVSVSSSKELDDFEDVIDEYTGEVVYRLVCIFCCVV